MSTIGEIDAQIEKATEHGLLVTGIIMSQQKIDKIMMETRRFCPTPFPEDTQFKYLGIPVIVSETIGANITLITEQWKSQHKPRLEPSDTTVLVTREALDEVYADVRELLLRKNHDYGNSWQRHGLAGVFVRLSDKALRLETLSNGRDALITDEATLDTLTDIVGYGLLGLLYERHNQ